MGFVSSALGRRSEVNRREVRTGRPWRSRGAGLPHAVLERVEEVEAEADAGVPSCWRKEPSSEYGELPWSSAARAEKGVGSVRWNSLRELTLGRAARPRRRGESRPPPSELSRSPPPLLGPFPLRSKEIVTGSVRSAVVLLLLLWIWLIESFFLLLF